MFTNTFSLHLINYSFCDKLPYIKATQQLREMVHSVATNKYAMKEVKCFKGTLLSTILSP